MKAWMNNRGSVWPTLALLGLMLMVCICNAGAQQLSDRQKTAQAMFVELCKKSGEKIYRTVENVEGIFLMKLRPGPTNFGDQFKLDDPYGRDLEGDGYIQSFVRGSYQAQTSGTPIPGAPSRIGYLYLEAIDLNDGKRYRYTGGMKVTGRKDPSAPNVQIYLKRDPNYDLNIYRFVLDRVPATDQPPRYGVTYDDISTRQEREYWIAGSSLKVIDLKTSEVMAERIGYMVDWAQGSKVGGRSPWLFAADNACPTFKRNILRPSGGRGFSSQAHQTQDFVEKTLKPSK